MAQNSTRLGISRDLLSDRQRVAVTPAASIPRIQFSSGAARALQDFSATLFNTSQRIEDRLDQQAAVESQVEGATAGAAGDFELRDYSTIRGREFNRAAIEGFTATLETTSITRVAELQRQFANDPAGLSQALQSYHQGVAGQLNRYSPSAGAGYLHRATTRAQPAIARAEDSAFRLTKDQADAALIASQNALDAEMRSYAGDLFSDNPERSKAASQALGMVTQDLMRVYSAVDPVTGRPLYSATDRAKAQNAIRSTIFKTATTSWFSEQDDKAQAYLDFISGDFKIDLNLTGPDFNKMPGNVADAISQAAIRNDVDPDALATIAFIESKFRTDAQNPRSSAGGLFQFIDETAADYGLEDKFDAAQSADAGARLMADNQAAFVQALGRKPTTGELYLMHQQGTTGGLTLLQNPNALAVDLVGSDEVKLNGGRDDMTAAEFANIWIRKAESIQEKQSFSATQVLSEQDMSALDADMRAQIGFQNRQSDRRAREEAAQLEATQEEVNFDMSLRLYTGGQTIDGQEIPELQAGEVVRAFDNGLLTGSQSEAFLKALAQESPTQSDLTVYDEALRRLNNGEDITTFVLENKNALSSGHASSLIQQNREQADDPEGQTLTEEQRGYLGMLKDAIAPEGLLAKLDQGASIRSFEAQDEYRRRVGEGEMASDVARDIITRSQEAAQANQNAKLQKLLTPRFSVPGEQPGTIDPRASAAALQSAFQAGNISPESYARQRALILKWARIQKGSE